MRRTLLTSTALTTSTLITGAAWAADMPVKAPPRPVAPPFSWNGCYVGLNAGGAWVNVDQRVDVPGINAFESSATSGAFIGGGQIGCKWQRDPNWVFGLEGDIDYSGAKQSNNFSFIHGEDVVAQQRTKLLALSTIRATLGYAWERSLLFATGGLAIGDIDSCVSATATRGPGGPVTGQFSGCDPSWRTGWTAGAGFEYAFTDRISAKLEYLYFDVGHVGYNVNSLTGVPPSGIPATWGASAGAIGNLIRVGVNYKFY